MGVTHAIWMKSFGWKDFKKFKWQSLKSNCTNLMIKVIRSFSDVEEALFSGSVIGDCDWNCRLHSTLKHIIAILATWSCLIKVLSQNMAQQIKHPMNCESYTFYCFVGPYMEFKTSQNSHKFWCILMILCNFLEQNKAFWSLYFAK